MQFPDSPTDPLAQLYLEDTDRKLPDRIDVRMRYVFFKTIARGGKCLIQGCKDLHLSRTICYKSLHREIADDPIEQQRFLREARVTAMLQHPNTVPVYELGRDNRGHLYFTMKLVHGYTMRELLNPQYRDRYDLVQLIGVVIQVGRALEYSHAHGVIHRDIKPENILVGPFGEVLLLDWGLAKVWNREGRSTEPLVGKGTEDPIDELSITQHGKLQGTVAFMSPEQVERSPEIDGRTDLYSLGVILYEILCGELPAKGTTADQVIDKILHSSPERPSTVTRRRVPRQLEELTMDCLQKDPERRIQSAAELVRDLQQDWTERSVEATRPQPD
ncbi:MAG: protein kinase [Planctomycetaceae bacterium]|nr:protein kinase [Planctomycetaceae bacterium]MBP60901.1 protein kinase [Planctomycetaceae bacterium]